MLLVLACGASTDDSDLRADTPPPAAALVRLGEATPLDTALLSLEEELAGVLTDRLESQAGEQHLLRAEAISDRLLETQLPFSWITHRAYSVEAVLRQIQTLADRLVAQHQVARQFGSGVTREDVMEDAQALLERVRGLRQDLERGGEQAPESLDELLRQAPSRPVPAASAPAQAQPRPEPVGRPDTASAPPPGG